MPINTRVIVVGAGLVGAATAWRLAAEGREVTLLERFAPGHGNGSSHGSSRIFRRVYSDPFYIALTGAAEPYWQRLESEAGEQLRTFTGGLDTGARRDASELHELLTENGVRAEILAPAEVAERWPGLRVHEAAVFHEHAGWLNADATVAALVRLAMQHGAELVTGAVVERIELTARGVLVHAEDGTSWSAEQLVLASGAWLPEQLPAFLRDAGLSVTAPQFRVKQQEVFHFRQLDPQIGYPTIVHKGVGERLEEGEFYTLPSGSDGGPAPAMKIGQFNSDFTTTASGRDYVIDPRARAAVARYLAHRFPGLDPEPVAEMSCLFTMTADEDFLIDRVGPVTIASACSGHGAKFAPLLGKLVADVASGAPAQPRFALRA